MKSHSTRPTTRKVLSLTFAAGLMLSLSMSLRAMDSVDCQASFQYVCTGTACERAEGDVSHAEQFSYDRKTGLLTACIWTGCYSGKPRVLVAPESGDTTLIGQLISDNPSMRPSKRLVSLTIDARRDFVAVWSYAGSGLTFDQGTCTRK